MTNATDKRLTDRLGSDCLSIAAVMIIWCVGYQSVILDPLSGYVIVRDGTERDKSGTYLHTVTAKTNGESLCR